MTSDCKCRIVVEERYRGPVIVYCPLHEAAPQLLEVVEGAYGWLVSLPLESRPDNSWLRPLREAIVSARGGRGGGHGWTHPICGPCWYNMGREAPTRGVDAGNETCCMCGGLTSAGIYPQIMVYYRSDPTKMPCKGVTPIAAQTHTQNA